MSRTDWDKIPKEEQLFYVYVGHLRNEITILRKLLYLSLNNIDENEIVSIVNYSQNLVLIKILFGKFEEGWKLFKKKTNNIATLINSDLNTESKNAYNWLENYFTDTNKNLSHRTRHNFSFHYTPSITKKILSNIKDDDIFEVFVTDKTINCFLAFSEEIMWRSLRDQIVENDNEKSIKVIVDETQQLADKFSEFCDGCINYMFEKYSSKPDMREVLISNVTQYKETKIPFFLEN